MKSYRKDYPRPQLVRDAWENLNGTWDFAFDDTRSGEKDTWFETFPKGMEIHVPFTYETKMSGIQDESEHEIVWYEREVMVDQERAEGSRIMLHFEGSDYKTTVWVNGSLAGTHEGAYARFSFDITELVRCGTNKVTVRAEDSSDTQQPRGKQRWEKDNFGCWYVQTTGIWKTVWMEYVPEVSIQSVKMTPMLRDNALELEYSIANPHKAEDLYVEAVITFGDIFVNSIRIPVRKNHTRTTVDVYSEQVNEWGISAWTPDKPDLYDISFTLSCGTEVKDEVLSYFGMREIRIHESIILLNGEPLYQRLILDQGYWKDSLLTPPSEEALIEDIDKLQALGFNGLRKHEKTEDERFLYWCDVKGMLVWEEMPSFYDFTDLAMERLTKEWVEIVKQTYNHPSIITWTPFNESWGVRQIETKEKQQRFTEGIYNLTKAIDPYRPVISNDGWEHTVSDIITLHDYEELGELMKSRYTDEIEDLKTSRLYHNGFKRAFAKGYSYQGQPIILSEYGGFAFQTEGQNWGYGNNVRTEEEYISRYDTLTTAVKEVPNFVGYCFTQVTDVQQEVNGLMDIDRNFKVDPEAIREINERPVGKIRIKYT